MLSNILRLHVWGEFACFTRPEMKVERVSYDVMTPSAARGILEAIYWKPEIRWRIERLHVLQTIRFVSLRRNEVGSRIPARTVQKALSGSRAALGLWVEQDRQQRAATILRDVGYVVEARFEIVNGELNVAKHLDQFARRARQGRCFHRPYLGCREFPAAFRLIEDGEPIPESELARQGVQDLGMMLDDVEYIPDPAGPIVDAHLGSRWRAEPRFIPVTMVNGVIDVEACRKRGDRP